MTQPNRRFADLSPKEAEKLVSGAVASGVLRAFLVWSLLVGALWLAVVVVSEVAR